MSGFKFGALSFLRGRVDAKNFPVPRTASPAPLDEPARAPVDATIAGTIKGGPITAASLAPKRRPALVFVVDTTGSRQRTWKEAKALTDTVIAAVPDELEVALAVYGGGKITFDTDFTKDAGTLRDRAASITCQAGGTQLLPILKRVAGMGDVPVVVFIGDAYEEGSPRRVANALKDCGTRVIILHEGPPPPAFGEIVERTGGALLPFEISSLDDVRALLQAVAVLAVGDVELLKTKQATMPAATLLLEHLDPSRLLIGRRAKP